MCNDLLFHATALKAEESWRSVGSNHDWKELVTHMTRAAGVKTCFTASSGV